MTASRFDGLRRWLIAEQVAGADSGGAAPGAEGEPRGPGIDDKQALRAKLRDEVLKGLVEWADEAGG